ncbi:MAG TPA: ribonuclease III [Gammaproteobacteria bacterium]|nr:ribonuclease III [Gammaproteobacteria bacterium]
MNQQIIRLSQRLGYQFQQPKHLEEALTHRSAAACNNERLEFLGDGVLNFIIGAELFRREPSLNEGELSRLRATLVREETLAEIGRSLELGEYLTMGSGELKTGGFQRSSILADAVEAVFGAAYLDGGFEACRDLVLRLYQERLENLPDPQTLKDPKTRLQEYLQSRQLPLPEYDLVSSKGKAHDQTFTVECRVYTDNVKKTDGQSKSRRKAEQAAALAMIKSLGVK